MVFGKAEFKCDDCGKLFVAPAAEWMATVLLAPMPCPKCGSMHTYPAGITNAGSVFGLDTYRKIWEIMDKE